MPEKVKTDTILHLYFSSPKSFGPYKVILSTSVMFEADNVVGERRDFTFDFI